MLSAGYPDGAGRICDMQAAMLVQCGTLILISVIVSDSNASCFLCTPRVPGADGTALPGDVPRVFEAQLLLVGLDFRDPDLAALPGHVGVVPLLPCDVRAVGGEAGRCVEVGAGCEGRHSSVFRVDEAEGVDDVSWCGFRVVFLHGNDEMTIPWVYREDGVAQRIVF